MTEYQTLNKVQRVYELRENMGCSSSEFKSFTHLHEAITERDLKNRLTKDTDPFFIVEITRAYIK